MNESKFREALKNKKIPVLTIDKKYHDLTDVVGSTSTMDELETEINDLLKAQGKANNDIKDIKNLKKKLMNEIVANSDENSSLSEVEKEKKNSENSRLISECNEKIDDYEDQLLELPRLIDGQNNKLMLELMENCYDELKKNDEEIERIAKWITQVRIELKKNLVRKTDMETKNQKIYEYMHDIFGAEVIEIFDMKYKDIKLK